MRAHHGSTHPLSHVPALLALILAGCGGVSPIEPTPTPTPAPAVIARGVLHEWPGGAPVPDREVALCALDAGGPDSCTLLDQVATTDSAGRFAFAEVPSGDYLVLYASGLAEFAPAVARLAGQEIRPGDWPWIAADLLAVDPAGGVNVPLPEALAGQIDPAAYGVKTLMVEGSPFVVAHTVETRADLALAIPTRLQVAPGAPADMPIRVAEPARTDLAALRAASTPLTRDEARLLDPALAARWNTFLGGDDTAYRDTDARLIDALRAGSMHLIGDTLLTAAEVDDGRLVKRLGYLVYDHQTGDPTVVGWLEPSFGDVVEASTGYHLAVLDNPGEWIEAGPSGEQFYHYGYSYYRHWRRILPDPIIALAEDFRVVGAAHVQRNLGAYQDAARAYDQGDMTIVRWDASTAQAVAEWLPSPDAPPYLTLPDSGTVDVRRERFLEAVTSGAVVVDEPSVWAFLSGDVAGSGFFMTDEVTAQQIMDALVIPYRSGHLFNDMEAAIILAATYGGDGPLRITINQRLSYGVQVPRRGTQISVADGEVADVIVGYPGTLNARWPHEMSHVLDFRDTRNSYPMRPAGGSRCEPLKYMLEYMWWVERYPYDAPDDDWMPVGSGLTLARLLTGTYPNSGC